MLVLIILSLASLPLSKKKKNVTKKVKYLLPLSRKTDAANLSIPHLSFNLSSDYSISHLANYLLVTHGN